MNSSRNLVQVATGEGAACREGRAGDAGERAARFLEAALAVHRAGADPAALAAAVAACRSAFGCPSLAPPPRLPGAEYLEALAAQVGQCSGARGCCAALAGHLTAAARAVRAARWAALVDATPPSWILDRRGRVLEANRQAREIIAAGTPVAQADGCLHPLVVGGSVRLARLLGDLRGEAGFVWPGPGGRALALRLRPQADGITILATLEQEADPVADLAPGLAQRLNLPPRQSELAAHLLAGHSVSAAARAMGISRATAQDHLVALQRRLHTADRQTLVSRLLAASR